MVLDSQQRVLKLISAPVLLHGGSVPNQICSWDHRLYLLDQLGVVELAACVERGQLREPKAAEESPFLLSADTQVLG